MPCTITITNVVGVGNPGGGASPITVTGTTNECTRIRVELVCTGTSQFEFATLTGNIVNGEQEWEVIFTSIECICGEEITVKAECMSQDCENDEWLNVVLECVPLPPECPEITGIQVNIDPCIDHPVDGPGHWVQFTPTIVFSGAPPVFVEWQWGENPGDPSDTHTFFWPGTADDHRNFYTIEPSAPPILRVIGPAPDCLETSEVVPLTEFDPWESCACPEITDIEVDIALNCVLINGVLKRLVKFTPIITGPTPDTWIWNVDSTTSFSGTGSPSNLEHYYENIPAEFPELCITGPNQCPQICFPVPASAFDPFSPCPPPGTCPEITDIDIDMGPCKEKVDGGYTRKVTFNAVVSGPAPDSFEWDWGDVTPPPPPATSPGPTNDHTYDVPEDTSVTRTVTVTSKGPDGCPDVTFSKTITLNCQTNGSSWCCVPMEWIAGLLAVSLALGVFMLAVTVCTPFPVPTPLWVAAAIPGVVGLILLGIRYFCCWWVSDCSCPSSCDWLMVAWYTSLVGAIAALFIGPGPLLSSIPGIGSPGCCNRAWGLLVLALFAAFYAAFRKWVKNCQATKCEIYHILQRAIILGGVTIVSSFALVPFIAACAWKVFVGLLVAITLWKLNTLADEVCE